jgi:hypothetical protein
VLSPGSSGGTFCPRHGAVEAMAGKLTGDGQIELRMSEKLATNMAMAASEATSLAKSIIGPFPTCSMFLFCSFREKESSSACAHRPDENER